jgi:hypothetical protein
VAAGRARGSRPRRVSLPGVAELLRPVGPGPASDSGRQASGREAHSQKITVYLSADELLDLERVRLTLRAHGIGVDRGRLVREAIALLMMDLEAGIDASVIARRLGAAGRPGRADPAPAAPAVLASVTHGAPGNGALANDGQVTATLANGAPAEGGLHHGAPTNGVLTGGALANGGPVTVALAHGVPAQGGPVAGAPAEGGPVADVLAHGVPAQGGPVAGAPAGAQ